MTEQVRCFHCGLSVPPHDTNLPGFVVQVDNEARVLCCAGCAAVAQAIVANGLQDYYRHRAAFPESPLEPEGIVPPELSKYQIFDHAEIQKTFVRPLDNNEREAALILEGITCSACIWLNETYLRKLPGVSGVDVNYATRRARVRWDDQRTKLSTILKAISDIGYRAHPYDVTRSEEVAQRERKTALWRLFVAGFGMMQVMMYAVPVYLADVGGDMSLDIAGLMRWSSLLLTAPVVLYSAAPFFRNALRDMRLRRVGMDVPVAIGVGSAFAASAWATLTGNGEVYFDSVTMFVFFLLGGRYFELMARQKAARGIETVALAIPALANRYTNWPNTEVTSCAAAELTPGDVVLIRPGEVVPADGVVVDGATRIDESLLTGESLTVSKSAGDTLVGGSVNVDSHVSLRVEKVGEQTRLANIVRLMERAALEKPHIVVIADKVAGHFVGGLLLVAVLTASAWWWHDPTQMLSVFVAVLVVSCPCALSLATPTALTVGTGAMAGRGLLVTRGHAIETLARIDRVVFDKTGTLTEGSFSLKAVLTDEGKHDLACAVAAALEHGSEHPVAHVLRQLASEASGIVTVATLRTVAGAGIEGVIDDDTWRIGRPDFVAELHALDMPSTWLSQVGAGETAVALGNRMGWVALFLLGDHVRPDAARAVTELHDLGVASFLLSGDAPAAVSRVATVIGLTEPGRVWSAHTPEQKHAVIAAMQGAGHVVAMVGDGINDAPVLAQAQVSIAMSGGADLARSQADVVLLGTRLTALPEGVALARRTMRVVRQNLYWAAGYNAIAVPLAMMGWVTPWMAGIGMATSSLLVVLNALRLQAVPKET